MANELADGTAPGTRLVFLLEVSDENLIGFNDVSGYYGPGAFAAWFLLILSCYYHFIRRMRQPDWPPPFENLTLFLLLLNGSAADLFNRIKLVLSLGDDPVRLRQQGASLAAAIIFVYFGVLHGMVLFWLGMKARFGLSIKAESLLLVGLLLPSASLAVLAVLTLWQDPLMLQVIDFTPAFYFSGIGLDGHQATTMLLLLIGPVSLVVTVYFLSGTIQTVFSGTRIGMIVESVSDRVEPGAAFLFSPALLCVVLPLFFLGVPIPLWLWLICLAPWVLLGSFPGLAIVMVFTIVFGILWSAQYRPGNVQVCYWCPCTPQKILEMDQLGALLAGCFVFAVFELRLHRHLLKLGRGLRRTGSFGV